jgi:thiol-disulfide isomerase/thioredoxin/uncharacterized membrane protein
MSEHTQVIFSYLKGEDIQIDKEEFNFQVESHPDYPSLLSLSDALTFFNINNGAIRLEYEMLAQLPDRFIITNNTPASGGFLSYIEREGHEYFRLGNDATKREKISTDQLQEMWGGIVLLVEKDESVLEMSTSKRTNYLLVIPFLLLFGGMIWQSDSKVWHMGFYLFSFVGLFFSLAALKDLLNTKSALIDSFCRATTATDCNAVVNSSRWKIFERVSFSDLSLTFFTTQLIALLIMGIGGNYQVYFSIQMLLLLFSVPVILTSVYYQKFVEKKWCPICLSIAGVVLLELAYLLYFVSFDSIQLTVFGAIQFFFVYSSVLLAWYPLKKLLNTRKELKEQQMSSLRFKKNYTIFKNNLIAEAKIPLWEYNPLVFGNPEATTVIDIITSPFCGYCKDPHYMLEEIVQNYGDQLKVRINYSFNPDSQGNEEVGDVFRTLVHLRMEQGENTFNEALDVWLQGKNREEWLLKYKGEISTEKVDTILRTQYQWCQENGFSFTPNLLINGYVYPKAYDISDLPYYVGELVEDTNF